MPSAKKLPAKTQASAKPASKAKKPTQPLKTAAAAAPSKKAKTPALPIRRIAVIGGGPKAVALATKAKVLRQLGIRNVEVTIFEPTEVGAAWSGADGYTDGNQQLCTPPDRDVGFPYSNEHYVDRWSDKDVASAMLAYSWQTYLVSAGESEKRGNLNFGRWIDAERARPFHRDFVAYLKWALNKAGNVPITGWVQALEAKEGKWRLHVANDADDATGSPYPKLFDGVVVTGAGPAKHVPVKDTNGVDTTSLAVFDGKDFWSRQAGFMSLVDGINAEDDAGPHVVVIGAGGTAAAFLSWMMSKGYSHLHTTVLVSQTLYARDDSVFENELFTDSERWATLSRDSQKAFFERLTRGVVWRAVHDRIKNFERLSSVAAYADKIVVHKDNSLEIKMTRGDEEPIDLKPAVIIDASGFDAHWFLKMVKGLSKLDKAQKETLEETMEQDLSFAPAHWKFPRLHAPMLSNKIGPGYASLMVLGKMADRILGGY